MPQRVPDSWAWWRTVMSADGPTSTTTRFVLCGYLRFMDRQGTRCWPGVRRLARVTGLNKDTITRHRLAALAAGWLIPAPASGRQHPRELWAAVPDGIAIDRLAEVSGRVRRSPPVAGQAVSALNLVTVRSDTPERPKGPDVSLISLSTLRDSAAMISGIGGPQLAGEDRQAAELRFRQWLTSSGLLVRFPGDVELIKRMVPWEQRFSGYPAIIQEMMTMASRTETQEAVAPIQASPEGPKPNLPDGERSTAD